MRKLNHTATVWLLVFIASFLTTCQKDRILSDNLPQNFNWSSEETAFFALQSSTSIFRNQNAPGYLYHPLLLEVRQKLIQENETKPFVEAIVNHTGFPVWAKSYVYCNPITKDKLVLIPLSSSAESLVTGFITLYKKDDGTDADFVINGMSRSELLDTTSGNPYQKAEYVKFMMKYDKLLFQKLDDKLANAYCHYKSKTINNPPSAMDPPPFTPPSFEGCSEAPSPSGLCEWRILQVCTDSSTNYTWFGGTDGPLPNEIATWFDGDHDDDGILDQEDEDYIDWYWEFDDWWHLNYDLDWPDFFDGDHDNDGILDEFDPDWDDFFSVFEGQLEDLGDWFRDIWDDVDTWWDDIWDGEIGCPFEDPPLTGSADERTITCEWFYVLDCGAGAPGTNWYDTFVDVVPCPECPGYMEYHDMLRDRLYTHWDNEYSCAIDFWDLYEAYDGLDWNCNAYSPCFESCVDENFAQTSILISPPEGESPITDLNADLQACFGQSCSQCTYNVTLYIDQPVPGSREMFEYYSGGSSSGSGPGFDSGHTFISLSETNASGSSKRKTIGFYPPDKPKGQQEVPGYWFNETGNTVYNIKVHYDITPAQFDIIRATLASTYWIFQIQHNNCTVAATSALIAAGIPIPKTSCDAPLIGTVLASPSNLGEDLRSNPQGGIFHSLPNHVFLPSDVQSTCQ